LEIKPNTRILVEEDFDAHPLWRYDDETDLYYPIMSIEEVPEYSRSLFIRARFYSPAGIVFNGYLVGAENIYCIGIFCDGCEFMFNKNLPDRCFKSFNKLIENMTSGENLKISDIFPLKYETTINIKNYRTIIGEFNAFEKLKDTRAMKWKKD
jgi:hypothetical protein